ncbi:triose-phosphate isomerase [Thaumasiovibrio sp. DFM-14]|uniref:triose-phosphate isomerase n=1 Tax=Thaumasiovibrio sp. DFM-14 TaxID=3384792 RepID=UPI0039A2CF58
MKKNILINLKRFDVPRAKGGVCQNENPITWIKETIQQIIDLGWGCHPQISLSVFVPDILLHAAVEQLNQNTPSKITDMVIGTQSCHREDVSVGGNFGAFTSHPIAITQATLGSRASIIGHCEERRHLNHVITQYADAEDYCAYNATRVVSHIISEKASCALEQQMKSTICIGETAEERGQGDEESQLAKAKEALENQIVASLSQLDQKQIANEVIIAYEPVWAIGPGKTPPESDYIALISEFIKETVNKHFNVTTPVVYGGGLKAENAAMLADISSLDGGLIALTNFTQPIGFYPKELDRILTIYTGQNS